MISFIRGRLVEKSPASIIVETGGIGYIFEIPVSSFDRFGSPGEEVTVLAHLHVREDKLVLYGFATEEERKLFRLLISVSGVGPKLAQGILSGLSVKDFNRALRAQDTAVLTSAPGVGKRTAERLIVELKDKVEIESEIAFAEQGGRVSSSVKEAVMALVSLGYQEAKAQRTVSSLFRNNPDYSVEELVKNALQKM
ncbi:Holliday junction branch migration protein RuvA [bacterium]|nr:Holliday junction branch migration protein RuvA [bacterium]